MSEKRIDFSDYFVYDLTVRATLPSGRFIDACSSCASNEKEKFAHTDNDVRSIAETRASNKAVDNII